MRVELDIFSGRINPSWEVTGNDAAQLVDRLASGPVLPVDEAPALLGFRGFIVSASPGETLPPEIPAEVRVPPPTSEAPESAAAERQVEETTQWLLSTGRGAVDDELLAAVAGQIEARGQTVGTAEQVVEQIADVRELPIEAGEDGQEAAVVEPTTEAQCMVNSLTYQPDFWNNPARVRANNCYAYAMGKPTDTYAQPGRASGAEAPLPYDCAGVTRAAMRDGCLSECRPVPKLFAALVIWPGIPPRKDYHWYLWHGGSGNRFWAHKQGKTPVQNTDNRGRVIDGTWITPENCDRGPYTIFCGYLFAPRDIQIA